MHIWRLYVVATEMKQTVKNSKFYETFHGDVMPSLRKKGPWRETNLTENQILPLPKEKKHCIELARKQSKA